MIRFKVEIPQRLERRIQTEFGNKANREINRRLDNLLDALIQNTPIDTGYARSRWKKSTEEVFKLSFSFRARGFIRFTETIQVLGNDAPYIQYLNQGWSKQAPPFFIEQTILQQGFTPVRLV